MNQEQKDKIRAIVTTAREVGLKWREGSLEYHVGIRKKRKHLQPYETEQDYEAYILNVLNTDRNDVHVCFLPHYTQEDYFFSDGEWLVMFGADGVIITAFKNKNHAKYLAKEKGYTYLGTIKEAFE